MEEGFIDKDGNIVVSKKVTRVVTTTKTVYDGLLPSPSLPSPFFFSSSLPFPPSFLDLPLLTSKVICLPSPNSPDNTSVSNQCQPAAH